MLLDRMHILVFGCWLADCILCLLTAVTADRESRESMVLLDRTHTLVFGSWLADSTTLPADCFHCRSVRVRSPWCCLTAHTHSRCSRSRRSTRTSWNAYATRHRCVCCAVLCCGHRVMLCCAVVALASVLGLLAVVVGCVGSCLKRLLVLVRDYLTVSNRFQPVCLGSFVFWCLLYVSLCVQGAIDAANQEYQKRKTVYSARINVMVDYLNQVWHEFGGLGEDRACGPGTGGGSS